MSFPLLLAIFLNPGASGAALPTPHSAPSPAPRILNMRIENSPATLDWTGLVSMTEAPIVINLADGLFTYDYDRDQLIPSIAQSVEKSKDLTEYTFTIRPDAKWSDGRQIFAQDFVDGWLRLLSPQSTSIYSYYLFDIKNAREYNSKSVTSADEVGIKAVSDRVLKVTLKRPHLHWEETTAFWPLFPVRKDKIEKFGQNWWRAGVMVSSGPFIFDSYEQGKKLVLKRNPYFNRGKTNIDEVDIHFVLDEQEALTKYKQGFFAFLNSLPFESMKAFKNSHEYRPVTIMRHYIMALNTEKYPLSNKEFRKAILSALDAGKAIPKTATQLSVAKTLIPPPLPGSRKPIAIPPDAAAAKEHLKKSGVIVGKGFKFRILTLISEPFYSIGKTLQQQLSSTLGLDVELATFQNQEYLTYSNLGDYHATFITWTAKVLNSADFLKPYSNEAAHSRVKVSGPFYDQWIAEGIQATSTSVAEHAFEEAQKVIASEEADVHPLFFEKGAALVHTHVGGLHFNHMGLPVLKDVVLKDAVLKETSSK